MEARSPVEVLGAILDEVEGLRQTNARSYLPEALVREARSACDLPGQGSAGVGMLSSIKSLEGQTVTHVFDCNLIRGNILIACSDGAFIALEAEQDDDSTYIHECSRYGGNEIKNFLYPEDLVTMGLMSKAEQVEAEHKEKVEKATALANRLERQAEFARIELKKLSSIKQ